MAKKVLTGKDGNTWNSETAKEASKKGVEARRRKKNMQEIARAIAYGEYKATDKEKALLEKIGYTEEEITGMVMMTASMFKQAMNGNVKAIEFFENVMGEQPAKQIQVNAGEDFLKALGVTASEVFSDEESG